jgi:hypothetical protein
MITFLRSSSINQNVLCQHSYYLTYVLGFKNKVGVKGTIGTTTHKVLEILARIKKMFQDTEEDTVTYKDNEIDFEITVSKEDFLKEQILSPLEVDKINTSRINKSVYLSNAQIKYDHKRYGVDLVEKICDKCIEYYESNDHNKWGPIDRKHARNFTWMALDFSNGLFDPRKQEIVATENHFDIELDYDWAEYEYFIGDQHLKGKLRLKGTIDLTTSIGDSIICIQDFKTGRKMDWLTGKAKTYDTLHNDPQLLLYYYVAKKLYPEKEVYINIFFIRDGGPYTLCFSDDKLEEALEMFKKSFQDMKTMQIPRLLDKTHKHFMCNRVCTYYKEKMNGQRICDFIHKEIKKNGIDYVTETYTKPGHDLSFYSPPGAT